MVCKRLLRCADCTACVRVVRGHHECCSRHGAGWLAPWSMRGNMLATRGTPWSGDGRPLARRRLRHEKAMVRPRGRGVCGSVCRLVCGLVCGLVCKLVCKLVCVCCSRDCSWNSGVVWHGSEVTGGKGTLRLCVAVCRAHGARAINSSQRCPTRRRPAAACERWPT